MKAVITVVGMDKIGIIYHVTSVLVEYDVNILDINQTIMDDIFTMVMLVDTSKTPVPFEQLQKNALPSVLGIGTALEINIAYACYRVCIFFNKQFKIILHLIISFH